jgi:Fuc2NAc and GlcNAc transferase
MAHTDAIALLLTFAASVVLTGLVRRHALARGIMDIPNQRSSHTRAVPRGGGAAIALTCIAAVVALAILQVLDLTIAAVLISGGALVGLVGYLDDARGLKPLTRFVVHMVASVVAVSALLISPAPSAGAALQLLVSVTWIVGIAWSINLFNFMDGIDGIAGSQATFVAGATALLLVLSGTDTPIAALGFATAGACLGFLVWNWPAAKIFMGDVGSGFLGFWLAIFALTLHVNGTLSVWTSLVLNGAFIADASVTLGRRIARGARWYEAHRSHAYQRLSRRWRTHAKVTWLLWMINLVLLLPLAVLTVNFPTLGPGIAAAALTILALGVALLGAGSSDD